MNHNFPYFTRKSGNLQAGKWDGFVHCRTGSMSIFPLEGCVKPFRIFCLTGIFVMTVGILITAPAEVSGMSAASLASQDAAQETVASPNISGAWQLSWTALNGIEHQGTMQIQQDGKTFNGIIKGGRGKMRLKGTLDGNQISITLKERRKHFSFNGTIDGDKMSGTTQQGVPWSATRQQQ